MKIESTQGGGIVSIGSERAKKLLESKAWKKVVERVEPPELVFDDVTPTPAPETPAEPTNDESEGQDTEETTEEAHEATTAEIRAWAKENTDLDVPSRGKLPDAAREAYKNAH